jgi:hypothetical protein
MKFIRYFCLACIISISYTHGALQPLIKRPAAEVIYDEIEINNKQRCLRVGNFLLERTWHVEQEDIQLINSLIDLFELPHNTLISMDKEPRTGIASISVAYLNDQTQLPSMHICKQEWLAMTQAEKAFLFGHEASHYVLGHLAKREHNNGWFNTCRTNLGSEFMTVSAIIGFYLGGLFSFGIWKNKSYPKKFISLIGGSASFYTYYLIAWEFDLLQQQEKEADLYAAQKLQSIEGGIDFFDTDIDWCESIIADVAKLRVHPTDNQRVHCLREWWREQNIAS